MHINTFARAHKRTNTRVYTCPHTPVWIRLPSSTKWIPTNALIYHIISYYPLAIYMLLYLQIISIMHTLIHAFIRVHTHIFAHPYTNVHIRVYTSLTHTHTRAHTHTHTYTNVHSHMYTLNTHTPTLTYTVRECRYSVRRTLYVVHSHICLCSGLQESRLLPADGQLSWSHDL